MKVFLDTNVLISAFITRGLCSDIFRLILSEHDLVLCTYVLSEFEDFFKNKLNLPVKQINAILQYLRSFEVVSDHTPPTEIVLRDKNDIPVLSAALNSHSDFIVTGDKDLLEVSDKFGIRVVDPRTFFQIVKSINNL